MHTVNSPVFSTGHMLIAIVGIASSTGQDVHVKLALDVVHS